jgi:hypothetical protein
VFVFKRNKHSNSNLIKASFFSHLPKVIPDEFLTQPAAVVAGQTKQSPYLN